MDVLLALAWFHFTVVVQSYSSPTFWMVCSCHDLWLADHMAVTWQTLFFCCAGPARSLVFNGLQVISSALHIVACKIQRNYALSPWYLWVPLIHLGGCSVDSLKDMGSEMSSIALPSHYLVFVGNSTCSVSGASAIAPQSTGRSQTFFLCSRQRGCEMSLMAKHITATFDELYMNWFSSRLQESGYKILSMRRSQTCPCEALENVQQCCQSWCIILGCLTRMPVLGSAVMHAFSQQNLLCSEVTGYSWPLLW